LRYASTSALRTGANSGLVEKSTSTVPSSSISARICRGWFARRYRTVKLQLIG